VAQHGWLIAGLMVLTLSLDWLDGWIARRFAMTSAFGARLDQELDAVFILVLAFTVFQLGKAGIWVLAAGLWRYGFLGLIRISDRFRTELPFSHRRRTVCGLTVAVLILCIAPAVQPPVSNAIAATAVLLLSASFLIDIVWLSRRRSHPEV